MTADVFDRATELEEKQRAAAVAAFRERPIGASLSHCYDCGDPIPEARRLAVRGCRRCVSCQQQHEQGIV